MLPPRRFQRPHVGGDPALLQRELGGIRGEHLAGVHPEIVDRRLHPVMRFRRAVAQPDHPVARALDVVGGFLGALGGDLGHARVLRLHERAQREQMPGVEQELPRRGVGIVAVRLLDQQQIAELAAVAR